MTKANPTLEELGLPRSDKFVFNGIDGSTGDYLTPSLTMAQMAEVAKGGTLDPEELQDAQSKVRRARMMDFGTIAGVDPNDLGQAGWALVFPQVEDGSDAAKRQAAILEALTPLRQRRKAQASAHGHEHYYQEYTGERGYMKGESKQQYLAKLGAAPGPANPEKVPYYLLLVASPEEIPYRVQYQIDVQYAVGRLHFDEIADYAKYAQSVVEAETGAVTRERRAAFFGVCAPDDQATQLSHHYLVKPLANFVEEKCAQNGWSVERYLADAATHRCLGELYGNAPGLLFSASHGVGFPMGHEHQNAYQGAFLCQDWGGPKADKLRRGHYFTAEDLDPKADLRGMIGVHFACYGMGTPRHDDFASRVLASASTKEIAPHDLVARLPQAMLANPGGGALATIGHVDRAWGSSFLWIDAKGERQTQRHLDVFESALLSLLDGKRVGFALEFFNLRYAEMAADLSSRIEEMQRMPDLEVDDQEIAQMWTFNNDARNYAVLGDPAVRLFGSDELAGQRGSTATAAELRAAQGESMALGVAPAPRAPAGATPGADAQVPVEGGAVAFGFFGGKDDEPGMLARLGAKVADTLGNVISDAVTLEVKTYVSRDMQQMADAGAGASLTEQAGAQLRAYTRCALDGDIESCVPVKPDGELDEVLWRLHIEMVTQAQAHRTQLVQTLMSLLSPLSGGKK